MWLILVFQIVLIQCSFGTASSIHLNWTHHLSKLINSSLVDVFLPCAFLYKYVMADDSNRSPADEASRTQNSANRASPKGAPDWLSFEYGELHLQDFLCVLWARTQFSDSEKLLQLIRHTMWRRSVSSYINKKIITDIVVYYFVHYERQALTKDLCFHVCCFFWYRNRIKWSAKLVK